MSLSTTAGGYDVVEYAGTLSLTPHGRPTSLRDAGIPAGCGILGLVISFLTNPLALGGFYLFLEGLCLAYALWVTVASAWDPVGWEISSGSISRKRMVLNRFRPREHNFRVEQVELAHNEWVRGWLGGAAPDGCSDLLRFWTRESGYVVIKSEDTDRTRRPRGGAGGADGAEITSAPPTGLALGPRDPLTVVGKTEVWTGFASVPPDMLSLAYLVQDALRRPLVVVVDTRTKPSDDDGGG